VSGDKSDSGYVWALKDINLEVMPGEVLGIIGKNGAGKSTLLKILSRVTGPTTGSISYRGRIGSLLEVGTGFHPELTGRENIFLNGAILGMTKTEISRKFDEIVDFAGVERYIDTPVKRYSSGMKVRLGFAVAAHLEPEILVVDEVLAVGDAEFQKKAVGKMQDVSAKDGRTILFVSHNMVAVQNLCSRVTILENGKLTFNGDVNKGINYYLSNNMQKIDSVPLSERKDRDGIGTLKFDAIEIINESGDKVTEVRSGQKITIKLKYSKEREFDDVNFRIQFFDNDHSLRFLCNSLHTEEKYHRTANRNTTECIIQKFPLPEGEYFINIRARSQNLGVLDDIEYATKLNVVGGDFYGTGKIPEITKGVLVNHFWA